MRLCLFAKPDAVHTQRLVAGLTARGFSVHVVYSGPGHVPGATYESFAVPEASWRHAKRRPDRRDRYVGRFFREHDLVAVHFLQHWGLTPEIIRQGRLAATPWGSDINPPPDGPMPPPLTIARRRMMLRHAHAISAWGHTFADQVARFAGIDPSRIEIVPLGVDLDVFRPPPQPPRDPIVGFFKGFGHAYGALDWVRAMPEVVRHMPGVRFDLLGDGPLLQVCRRLVTEMDLNDRVRFLPPMTQPELARVISSWQVTVMPSHTESFGVAALEASAVQLPIVASRVGGLTETVQDGRTGILVTPRDSNAIAHAVIDLLRDADKRIQLGRCGRQFVAEHFEADACIRRWCRFLERAASARVAA